MDFPVFCQYLKKISSIESGKIIYGCNLAYKIARNYNQITNLVALSTPLLKHETSSTVKGKHRQTGLSNYRKSNSSVTGIVIDDRLIGHLMSLSSENIIPPYRLPSPLYPHHYPLASFTHTYTPTFTPSSHPHFYLTPTTLRTISRLSSSF